MTSSKVNVDNKGLADRRERKRAKKDIVNPGRVEKPVSEDDGCSSNRRTRPKSGDMKEKLRKTKVPAGLALMYGFNAKNVGNNRLTVSRS